MKKINLFLASLVIAVLLVSVIAIAQPDFLAAKITNPVTGEQKNTVAIPSTAVEVAPNIFYLGTAVEKGKPVEGYAFIHKEKNAKPAGCNNDGKCQGWEDASCGDCSGAGDTSSCYGFLSKGAKWKTLENYIVNPNNTRSLDETFVRDNLALDIAKWETAASYNILGNEVPGIVDGADTSSPDNKNEVYFADVSYSGAIAITIVWGIFSGPLFARELVEWDQVYDDVDFDWSENCLTENCTTKMDFENIATHELGHSVGLDDLYNTCTEETMYGYAAKGETKKRDLNTGDITGIQKLYS